MKDDAKRVEDILEAILLIEKYSIRGREKFEENELIQVWIVHHLQIIGESVRKISENLKERHPEIPWPQIVAMRHILVHEYFGVDREEVWMTVEKDLPTLKENILLLKDTLAKQ